MKNIKYSGIIFMVFLLTACGSELDLQPHQSLSDEAALSNDANVKKALLGAYDALSYSSVLGGDMQLYGELLAADGEINWVGTYNEPREIFGKKIITTNGFVSDTWIRSYKAINICNNILGALDVVVEDDRDRVEGEAKFIRGLIYFELIELYAKPYSAGSTTTNLGVPIVLEPTREITADSRVSRATVEEVYTQILSDLESAESLLPDANDVFANKTAAAAILSRVYLQQEDFASARDAADRAIGYGTNSLVGSYAEAFNNSSNSSEDIFDLQVNEQDGDNSMHTYWSVPDYGGRDGDVEVLDKHIDFYDPSDDRLNLFYDGNGARRSGKWQLQFKNVPIVRLAEMYLTRAETNFREGTAIGDTYLNDLNLIRDRVGLSTLGTATLNDILLERKLEIAHEGQGIHDVKRLRLSVDGYDYDADKLVFPIPQREININDNLIQNPSYVQ